MRQILFSLLFLGSCHLGPRYEAPTVEAPSSWKTSSEDLQPFSFENWWDLFEDGELAKFEQQVIEKNPDLYSALEKVVEARAVAGVAKSSLYPQVNLNPAFNNINELIELYGVPPGLFPGLKTITRVREQSYQLPVAMSYEVDLWGKYRGTYHAAQIYAEAQDEAMRATLLTLTSDLASNYFNLRALDRQIELLKKQLDLRQITFEMTKLRFDAGLVSYLDFLQDEKLLSDTDAELQETVGQRALFENAMAALIGVPASEFHVDFCPLSQEPPSVPGGLPSDMLIRRPDLAQAERTMASVHELIGVAYSTYFPNISLTSNLGYSSPDLSQFLNWPSRLWQIGVNIAQVIFNAGRNRSYVEAALARFREAKGQYESAVLTAFREVEDALSNLEAQGKQFSALQISYEATKEAAGLSTLRYEKGISNYLDTLDAKRAEIEAERTVMNALAQRYQSSIQLIKALGGGWESNSSNDLSSSIK